LILPCASCHICSAGRCYSLLDTPCLVSRASKAERILFDLACFLGFTFFSFCRFFFGWFAWLVFAFGSSVFFLLYDILGSLLLDRYDGLLGSLGLSLG